jgi:hydroxyacylglutathione hydrolase
MTTSTFRRRRYRVDNYTYLLGEGGDALLVDPGDAALALGLLRDSGLRPVAVLHTHGHPDHTGGTDEVKAALGVPVLGHGADAAWYAPDEDLRGCATWERGALRLRIHPAPGHTPGSILVEWQGRLLTGDTLFWGGCGNCRHGGDPALLAATFAGALAGLDDALEVHPGHDYAAQNLPFALDLDPGNRAARRQLDAARAARAAGHEPEPTRLGDERAANPFLRIAELQPELARRGVAGATTAEAFVGLRALRDRW